MGTNNSTNNQLGNNKWETAVIDLSSADIKAMFGAPIPVIPSPGAGKFILINLWVFEYFYNSITYTGGGAQRLVYTTSLNALSNVITGIIADTKSKISAALIAGASVPLANMVNNGISIDNDTAAWITGNGTARAYIKYSIQDAP
jgi:hypothetical protein